MYIYCISLTDLSLLKIMGEIVKCIIPCLCFMTQVMELVGVMQHGNGLFHCSVDIVISSSFQRKEQRKRYRRCCQQNVVCNDLL